MKKMSVLLVSAFAVFAAILPAVATIGVTVNGTDISAGSGASPAWSYNGGTLALTASGASYVISGNNNGTNTVSIQAQANCTVVASNLFIDVSGTGDTNNYLAGVSALDCGAHTVTLALWSDAGRTNVFKGGAYRAGILTTGGSLVITNLSQFAALSVRGGLNGAGIGGGQNGAGGTVTVSGGMITSVGGSFSAGIGGGSGGKGGTVTVSGGSVLATGGGWGAGIGGGQQSAGGTVTVSGGSVWAYGTDGGAGIGGGVKGAGGTVTVSGGTMTVSGGTMVDTGDATNAVEDIGYGYLQTQAASGVNTFTGGSISLAHGTISQAPSNGTARVWRVTFPNVTTAAMLADLKDSLARLAPAYGVRGITALDGKVYAWLPDGDYSLVTCSGVWRARVDGAATTATYAWRITVNGTDISAGSGTGWTFLNHVLALTKDGMSYVISGNNDGNAVSIQAQADCTVVASNLTVDVSRDRVTAFDCGTNTVILALWSRAGLAETFMGGYTCAGIRTTDGSLTITNLNESAALSVQGGMNGAGIGGGQDDAGGTVTVCGGTVTATGGSYGAGIGGGQNGAGGTVTVSGGSVTATGGESGAGIGGGYSGAGGTVTVSGGTVLAKRGGQYYQDIGGWTSAASGANTFTGGSIRLFNRTISQAPSNGTARVWCVTVTGLVANAVLTLDGLDAYGGKGIVADAAGRAYLWLPDGNQTFTLGGVSWYAHVDGADTMASKRIGVSVGGIDIGTGSGAGWTCEDGVLELMTAGASYVISGNNGTNAVSIWPQANCTVVASNLVINGSVTNRFSPLFLDVRPYAVTLLLSGTNTLIGSCTRAGIFIRPGSGSLTISNQEASATLFVQGGAGTGSGGTRGFGGGAGIGGSVGYDCGTVTIAGGTVWATGSDGGAGIGGGGEASSTGNGGTVTISGGTVIATGDAANGAEDIGHGSGSTGSGANTFTGGSILLANGAISQAPSNGTARVWCVTFPNVTSAAALADITASLARLTPAYGVHDVTVLDGKVYAWLPDGSYSFVTDSGTWRATVNGAATTASAIGRITVNGTDISAGSGTNPAWTYESGSSTLALTAAGASYVISGDNNGIPVSIQARADCTVVASNLVIDVSETGGTAASIYGLTALDCGTNAVTLALWSGAGQTNTFNGGANCAGICTTDGSLAITNLNETAALSVRGGNSSAGIGGGNGRAGGTVAISGGSVSATGGYYGAGIGGGSGRAGGTVTVSGGFVSATGVYNGAGIGGGGGALVDVGFGSGGAGGTVTVSGGTVIATGGAANGAKDIGPGPNCADSGADTFTGGSIYLSNGSISAAPSNGTAPVWCVTFPYVVNATALADLTDGLARLSPAYGVNGIVARGGKVYAWLPDGDYSFATGNSSWRAHVNGAATTASYIVGVTINGTDIGAGSGTNPAWTYDGTSLALTAAKAAYVISGTNNGGSVSIRAQADCTVVASNLVIDASGAGDANHGIPGVTTFDCGTNAVTLALWSDAGRTNVFKSGNYCAGILTTRGSLAITNLNESAALSAQGGFEGAGIGGGGLGLGGGGGGGTVTISGGSVSATGGTDGAGIGGGGQGGGGTVTISGGSVSATGNNGAGIGGGWGGVDGGIVTVSGGFVSAAGGNNSAGIGGACYGTGGTVSISGGTVIATGDQANGAEDIGHGHDRTASGVNTFTGGSIRLANGNVSPAPSNVTARVWCVTFANITSAAALAELTRSLAALGYGVRDITAPDGKVYAWLPSGVYFLALDGKPTRLTIDTDGSADFQPVAPIGVTVNGRDIAYGSGGSGTTNDWSYNGANLAFLNAGPYTVAGANGTNSVSLSPKADGTTTLVLSNLTIDVSALVERTALWCGGHDTTLRLLGTNTLKSGLRRPGIQTTGATLAITNLEPAAALVATGGGDGAGIGGAQHNDGGTVRIYGGTITAAGDGGGSGIGGGAYGNGGNVKIFGGLVTTTGGNGAAGIGGGWDGNGGTLEVSGGTVRATRGDRGSVSAFYDIGGEIDHGESKFKPGANTFTGGSVWLANGLIAAAPSNGTERVFCVTNGGFVAGAPVSLGLSGYGTDGLVADASGNVYLWLPAGGYIEGGSSAAGSFLRGFGVTATGAVTGPTNAVLVITGFATGAGVTDWTPKAFPPAHVETIYSTNLTGAAAWSSDRPTNAPALFMRLRVK